MHDYLIVGQGLAGTLLAHFFEERAVDFKIADAVDYNLAASVNKFLIQNLQHPFHSASTISTGIINPVTGRRFVKSWMIDTLFPFAKKTYHQIEQKLHTSFYRAVKIYRTVPDQKAMTDFLLRLDDPAYAPFFSNDATFKPNPNHFNINKKGITIKQAARINTTVLLKQYRTHLIINNKFIGSNINYDAIELTEGKCTVGFGNNKIADFKYIIFCEGYRVKDNPYFNFLPFTGTNGQTLIIECPELQLRHLIKSGIFVIPLGKHRYQIGTTWNLDSHHPELTEQAYLFLKQKLDTLLKIPYTIVHQQAAVRPTIKDRRPVLGKHPKYSNLFLLNGLGAKGISLSPYFAHHLVEFLLDEKELINEVNIKRFI